MNFFTKYSYSVYNMKNKLLQKSEKIESLDGLKVIFFLAIFMMHASGAFSFSLPYSLPGSAVTAFFVLSGFGVALNYLDKEVDPFYGIKKIKQVYPIYLFSLILAAPVIFWKTGGQMLNDIMWLPIDLALLQSWTNNPMNWNGVAWFLSAIVFCYFMVPFLMKLIKKLKNKNFTLLALLILLPVIVKYLYMYLVMLGFNFSIYSFPIFRLFDFSMGLILAPIFIKIKDKISVKDWINDKVFMIIASLTEIISLIIWVCGDWISFATSTYFQCIIIFIFAFNSGIISHLFRTKLFQLMGKYNLELFLIHQPLITYVGFVHRKIISIPLNIKGIVLLAVDLIVAIYFRKIYNFILLKFKNHKNSNES